MHVDLTRYSVAFFLPLELKKGKDITTEEHVISKCYHTMLLQIRIDAIDFDTVWCGLISTSFV